MQSLITGNPFALMMDPEAVFQAMERSERLNALRSRVHRPLDKPLIPPVAGFHSGATAFDQSIEGEEVPDVSDDE
jgi:hypothetical protein